MGICEIDLLKPVGKEYQIWEFGSSSDTWAEVLTRQTQRGKEKLKSILSNYSNILSTKTITLIGQIIIHPWLEFVEDSQKRLLRNIERKQHLDHLTLGSDNNNLKGKYSNLAIDFGKKLKLLESDIKEQYNYLYKNLNEKIPYL